MRKQASKQTNTKNESGLMPNSDIMLGWVDDNGTAYIQDRHTLNQRVTPILDASQVILKCSIFYLFFFLFFIFIFFCVCI